MVEEEFESDADEVEMRMLDYDWSARELGGVGDGQGFLRPHIERLLEIAETSMEHGARMLAAFALARPGGGDYPVSYSYFGDEIIDRLTMVMNSWPPYQNSAFTSYLGMAITMVSMRMENAQGS